ncbi:MAG: hypothetical protein HPY69_08400 [Armatimonadetes bacterium]|nr:hypothetical protein [Armatimonadota bacterium]
MLPGNDLWRAALMLALCVWAHVALAQAILPLEFDTDPGWQPEPSFLSNPAAGAKVVVDDGVCSFRVDESGKGMKFLLSVEPVGVTEARYLLLRYRARDLAPLGYALWVFDGSQAGRQVLAPADLQGDGQWHLLALDMESAGLLGEVRRLVVEVQCAGPPAELSLDYLRLADEAPSGATLVPADSGREQELLLRGADWGPLQAEPDWLGEDATQYGVTGESGLLHLWAEGAGVGMKFSAPLPQPVDLSALRYAAIRYRAEGIAPWGDYLLWLGSEKAGGLPQQYAIPLRLHQLRADGDWHVAVTAVPERFVATHAALQVCSAAERGDIWIDTIRFTSRRPLLDIREVLSVAEGWQQSKLSPGSFTAVDLSTRTNGAVEGQLGAFGLKSWLPGGQVVVRGVPFSVPEGGRVVATPRGEPGEAAIAVSGRAQEALVLLAAKLPAMDYCRMGDGIPMEAANTPERLVFAVDYADGLTDEMFPVCLSSGLYEVAKGVEVYSLPALRPVPIRRLRLVNHMDSARLLIAGVTLNRGRPLAQVPAVHGLPPQPPPVAAPLPRKPPTIRRLDDGYTVETTFLSLNLRTRGGISLRALSTELVTGAKLQLQPGPLFEVGLGKVLLTSEQVTVGQPTVSREDEAAVLTVPVDASAQGVPVRGDLVLTARDDGAVGMDLHLTYVGGQPGTPVVNFPTLRDLRLGTVEDTWYLYARKGGLISNRPTDQRAAYGGQYPLQVADVFNPRTGGGLALLTRDLDDVYRFNCLRKDRAGVTWRTEFWPREYQPGEAIETVPTLLQAHAGDWRTALSLYQRWAKTWYRPQVPRKEWFQRVFYYQQVLAWSHLTDPVTREWHMAKVVNTFRDLFGCLDYLHIFDFSQSNVYGRVGDYSHYDELGGLDRMRAAIKEAQDMGVRVGLYIEGYLCDKRGVWGREHVPANCIIQQDGKPLMWPGSETETMMCAAAPGWRNHLAETYRRVAGELQPDGMYIDQYGFTDTWKTCWSREHGHPVPAAPLRGERDTTAAIRGSIPPDIANLTEETPNDVNSQYQDGALGYSVTQSDPALMPHRVDLFRFMFPDFKVFQLVCYNQFTEGGWDLLKWPFFNGEAWWLQGWPEDYCPEAAAFLKQAFAISHRYADAFTSADVAPLVPTLKPTVYANRFTGPRATVWTLYNAQYRTYRGDLLRVPHRPGTRYRDAFSGQEIRARIEGGQATIAFTIGPGAVGCVVAEQ